MRILSAVVVIALSLGACSKFGGAAIHKGAKVKINYTLTVDGAVLDTSKGREPLDYVQGGGQMIAGLEEQLEGMKAGEKKQVTLAPEKAYGPKDPAATRKVPKKAFQTTAGMKVGAVIRGQTGGQQFQATIMALSADDVTLDLNHPLAGKTLNFDVEILEVKPAG